MGLATHPSLMTMKSNKNYRTRSRGLGLLLVLAVVGALTQCERQDYSNERLPSPGNLMSPPAYAFTLPDSRDVYFVKLPTPDGGYPHYVYFTHKSEDNSEPEITVNRMVGSKAKHTDVQVLIPERR